MCTGIDLSLFEAKLCTKVLINKNREGDKGACISKFNNFLIST